MDHISCCNLWPFLYSSHLLLQPLACANDLHSTTAQVAQELGLRSLRRPVGYWDDITNLDIELSNFVAAHWSTLMDPDDMEEYYYNQITGRTTWEPPNLPQRIEMDDEGTYMVIEDEEDRVMPPRSKLFAGVVTREDLDTGTGNKEVGH